jgi:peroxiredoxin family protein
MLISGEFDRVLTAFVIANGFSALGVEMTMWFNMLGHNCLKKRRGLFSRKREPDPAREGAYRNLTTDNFLQPMFEVFNRGGANNLPLSQVDLMGFGSGIFRKMLQKKNVPSLEKMIRDADELGVKFIICQMCADALGLSLDDLIIPNAEVKGISAYMKDTMDAQVNLFI